MKKSISVDKAPKVHHFKEIDKPISGILSSQCAKTGSVTNTVVIQTDVGYLFKIYQHQPYITPTIVHEVLMTL
jgi:hypothetical protein